MLGGVCGWFMLVLNVAVSVIMFMVIAQNQRIKYHMIACIGLAEFTFYCFTRAVINMIKYSRQNNLIYAAVKRMDMLTGIVVTILINTIGALMIAGANGDVRVLENVKK